MKIELMGKNGECFRAVQIEGISMLSEEVYEELKASFADVVPATIVPKTGYEGHMLLYALLMLVAFAGLAGTRIYACSRKQAEERESKGL